MLDRIIHLVIEIDGSTDTSACSFLPLKILLDTDASFLRFFNSFLHYFFLFFLEVLLYPSYAVGDDGCGSEFGVVFLSDEGDVADPSF